ncbi:MAG: organic solvent tolerance protein [Bdellovibrionaceae bacterium]|nr:organic solvent tolerance protein [Pseudobdellovibrionaceae bacterium]
MDKMKFQVKQKSHWLQVFVFALALGCFFSQNLLAKDLSSRLGIGIKNNASEDVPSLAVVFFPNNDFAVTGGLGIDTQKDQSKFVVSGGVRKILFRENQMNFYFGGQLGVVNFETAGDKQNGFELNALFGGEFFFTGLESLAFTFEGGAGIASLKEVRFRTVADSPLRAGIIFYF